MKVKQILFLILFLPMFASAQNVIKDVRQLITEKNYDGAVKKASEILALVESTEVYQLRARAYHQLKNYKSEIADYKRALELNESADARLSLAIAYLGVRDSSEANRTLELNLKLHPEHSRSIIYSASLASYKKDPALALKILNEAYKKYGSPELLYARAAEYRRQRKYNEALSDYETILLTRKSSSVYMSAAQAASSAGDLRKTMEYYKKFIEVNPNNSGALSDAASQLQRSGNFTEAEIYYRKAIDIHPKNVYPLGGKALLLYHQGHIDDAFTMLDAALLYKSPAKVASLIRGYLNLYEGNLSQAESDLKEAMADKQKSFAYSALAVVYIYRGEYARAIDFITQNLNSPTRGSATAHNVRGFAYYKLGKMEEARKDWLAAKQLEEDYQPIYSYLELDNKSPVKNYTHVQFFTPFNDVNDSGYDFSTDGKKNLDFKIRIMSKDEVDASEIKIYESGNLLDSKYWSLKSVEKRSFKFMDMLVTDVAFQYTPKSKKSYLKLSYAGTDTQTQTILK